MSRTKARSKCKYCEIHKSGLGKQDFTSESGNEVAFIDEEKCFISYVMDDYDSRRAFKINYCPMCGKSLSLNAKCPVCTKLFEKSRKDQTCCSNRCATTFHQRTFRAKQKEKQNEKTENS